MGDRLREEKQELLSLIEERERRIRAEKIDCSSYTKSQSNNFYREVIESQNRPAQRKLVKTDLFFLLTQICERKDINRDWLYERCREVQASPNGHLDLWAREHYKSTIITYGKSIQDITIDSEITIGIFSHTRPIAKDFLNQIKQELETNAKLKWLFPEIFYENPRSDATKWASDSGLLVKRKTNPKEATIEAWGLVDGQPTGKHFRVLVYDDVVTLKSVTTPDQIKKTTAAWEMSLNLGAEGGVQRYIGTRYHIGDTYRAMMDRGSVHPRVKPATHDGSMDGEPVFMDADVLSKKRQDMGPYTYATQMLQNPVADRAMSFKIEWLKYYEKLGDTSRWNKYLLVDPASKRKKENDYTVLSIIGLAPDQNYYLLHLIRDRLNLTARAERVFELHREWHPTAVGYEEYGMQADIEHIEYVQEQKNYRFNIVPLGGVMAKSDRIKRLVPVFEQGRFRLPKKQFYTNYENVVRDLIKDFIEDEYSAFPVCVHDDILDNFARILDPVLNSAFPKEIKTAQKRYRLPPPKGSSAWMS